MQQLKMKHLTAIGIVVLQLFGSICSDKLIAATVVVNHGDTVPRKFYPTDPYQEPYLWKQHLGQLSDLGEEQSFKVGKWLLRRYIWKLYLVPLHYNASLIYTYSEDRDESLMSGECIMAGLLPPVGDEVWKKDLPWRPTPVHNAPLFLDHSIGRGMYCPVYERLLKRVSHGRYFRTQNMINRDILNYLTNHTGENFTSIIQIPALFNILTVERNHNFVLPNWTHAVFPHALAKLVLEASIVRTKDPEIALLSIGPFFHKIKEQFNDILNHSSIVGSSTGTIRKFRLFITNSTIFYDALHTLKVPSVGIVPFSATLMFELWETDRGSHYVKLLYKKSPDPQHPVEKLKIGGCKGFKCPFVIFNKTIDDLAVPMTEWNSLCNSYITPLEYTS